MLWVRGVRGSEDPSLVGSYCLLSCHLDEGMMIAILIPSMYQLMFRNRQPVLVIGITCTVTLSTINTESLLFKRQRGLQYKGQVLNRTLHTPQIRLRVINGELYFTYGKGTWGGGAYYLWGACCMRGNTV